jgi:hypothetical protein
MHALECRILWHGGNAELLPADVAEAQLTLEATISVALLELLGELIVDYVRVLPVSEQERPEWHLPAAS